MEPRAVHPRDMLERLLSWIASWVEALGVKQVQLPKDLLSWIEAHHGLASWVEALGVIAAICGSVYIARWEDRRTHRREREQQIKKAKSVAGCFVPILKIIEYDVGEILTAYNRVPRMTVRELRKPQYQFRPLPPFVPFVLENAHLLPNTAIIAVPQLLSLRELVANDIQTGLARRAAGEILSDEELRVITTWLGMMRQLVNEIYELFPTIHDQPIEQLLEQEPTLWSKNLY